MTYAEDYVDRLRQLSAAQVLGEVANRPVSKSELANLILQKARSDFSATVPPPQMPEEKKKGIGAKAKSVALGVMDILARPGYAFNEAANQAFNEGDNVGDVLKGAWQGFSGKKDTSYVDVLQNQYKGDILDDPEYQRLLATEPGEAAFYKETQERAADKSLKAIVGGTIVDIALDPLNAVGAGVITKPIKALKELSSTGKALEGIAHTGEEIATSTVPEASQGVRKTALDIETPQEKPQGLSPDLLEKLKTSNTSEQPISRATGNFASNRRPPQKSFASTSINSDTGLPVQKIPVKAMYGEESQNFTDFLREQPRYANLKDVFNRDIRQSDYQNLQKARVTNETAQIVEETAKGNPAAIDLLANKDISPLSPVARTHVTNSVQHIVREITESISDPAKAKAAGKQPRWPIYNAPTQNNMSNKLTQAARQQFKAENKAYHPGAPKFVPAVYSNYLNMLKNAEESLIEMGRTKLDDAFYPRGGIKPNSPYLRLSDVLETLPQEVAQKAILGPANGGKVLPSIILKAVTGNNAALGKVSKQNPELFNAIQNTDWAPLMTKEYATRVIDASNAAHKTIDESAQAIAAKTADNASDAEKAGVVDAIVKTGKNSFKKELPEAKTSVYEMLDGLRKSIPNPLPSPVDVIINRGKVKLANAVFDSSKTTQKAAQGARIEASQVAIDDALEGLPANPGTDVEAASKAADGIFGTVLSWVDPARGYKDLRPLLLKNIGVRRASATTRAHEIIKTFGQIPKEQHMDFWNAVRGFIPPVAEQVDQVKNMQKLLGNIFGESGLSAKFAGNTSLARAGVNINHLNKHLRIVGIKDFKFTDKVKDPLDPSKMLDLEGPQILETWKNYQPENSDDLRKFMYNLTQAAENAMVEYSTFANAGANWGSKVAKANHIEVSGMHPAIDGMFFPKDIASQIGKLTRGIDEMFEPISQSKLMKVYDAGLRTWKSGVTIYAPSHHIRNMIGDMFTSYLDGVSNPIYYSKSGQVLLANAHAYSDIKTGKSALSNILGEGRETDLINDIIGQSKRKLPKGTRVIATARVGNKRFPVTIDQIYQMAFRQGILPHSSIIEDLPGSETLMETLANKFHPDKAGIFAPAKGNIAKGVRAASETREHYVRMAHFLYAIENTKASSLSELFEKSAGRVRKYHPDGLDLTRTEKQIFRRVMPFYSWTRKAIPLILEGIVMNPSKILLYPKLMSSLQESQGIDSSISDPWPDNQLFPDWLSGNVIGPVLPPNSPFAKAIARSDSERGYTLINPGMPSTDLLEDFGNNPIKGIGNSLTPALKIPAEIGFGREFQSGAPIQDKTEYIDKNIPLLSTISRMTNGAVGTGLAEGGDLKGKETSAQNLPALLNYLTGAGIIDTGRYKKGGEFDLKARIAEEKKNGAR